MSNEHIKSAIRQIDDVQTGKADIDKLADAAMHLDLALAELEAARQFLPVLEHKYCKMHDAVDDCDARAKQESKPEPTKLKERLMNLRNCALYKLLPQDKELLDEACDRLESQAEQLKDKHTISSEDAEHLSRVSSENIDLKVEIERLKKAWDELRPRLEPYNYEVSGKPTLIMQSIVRFKQALKGE